MHSTDKIAILMATYNGEKYICQQIDSILSQTCTDWELYIHDDGSTDNTIAAVESYVGKYPDKIHLIDGKSTGGAKYNFFYLFSQVEAPYYMTCDQDDVWLDKKIELTYDKMLAIEDKADIPCLVYTELRVVDGELNTIADTMSEYQSLDCHKRTINQFINPSVVKTCQLSMGLTQLAPGSNWNTMPCHTHERRMEAYMYFEVPDDQVVFHMMGEPNETRHIVMKNFDAVISPSWSIHSGVGTSNYTFIWAMVGENMEYDDMDTVDTPELK